MKLKITFQERLQKFLNFGISKFLGREGKTSKKKQSSMCFAARKIKRRGGLDVVGFRCLFVLLRGSFSLEIINF